jgi:hypothetical protein
MLVATRSFTAADGTEIRGGISRVSEDHPLADLYADAFIAARSGPPEGERGAAALVRATGDLTLSHGNPSLAAREDRLPLAEELAVRQRRLAELEQGETGRYERAQERRRREFWDSTARFLAGLEPPEPSDAIHDLSALDAEQERAALAEVDESWGSRAPWNN